MTSFVLLSWPAIILVLINQMTWPRAVAVSIVAAYLILPTQIEFDFPLLPSLNKHTIPVIALMLLALVMRPDKSRGILPAKQDPETVRPGWIPRSPLILLCFFLMVSGNAMTALTNGDRQTFGPTSLPGLRPFDAFAMTLTALTLLLPFFLGRKFFGHPDTHKTLLKVLVVAGLVYTLPALFEIRMSPQLNVKIYGFFPHNWQQHIRAGGFRPIVFLEHGLLLALFFSLSVLSAFGLSRVEDKKHRSLYLMMGAWILLTLALSNSFGGLVTALLFMPIVLILHVRGQMIFVAVIAVITLTYPVLRSADIVPTERLVQWAEVISDDRARSLNFRFENEDRLLTRAQERPFFGWGGFGRHNVFDERGRDITVAEGAWIIAISGGGWFQYIADFGVLTIPMLLLAWRRRSYNVTLVTSILCVVLAANLMDLLPNAGRTPITMLIAGAIAGRLEFGRLGEKVREEGDVMAPQFRGAAPSAQTSGTNIHPDSEEAQISIYTRQTKLYKREKTPGKRRDLKNRSV
ncbi:O-antigen ligase family protein [Jannaschia sp. CCS1]|uniref:O-antigen ligase family protein n=1 Tax=Jannaschia sp. (strain CCS1) TaxID=290400 RepID=UPI000053C788|nr:O-antigen ligase family protein [Jannaschia sp. CCS1]ABD57173.1 hypothetical protein Jann_4257 [Jannaschia sp. CCS1]